MTLGGSSSFGYRRSARPHLSSLSTRFLPADAATDKLMLRIAISGTLLTRGVSATACTGMALHGYVYVAWPRQATATTFRRNAGHRYVYGYGYNPRNSCGWSDRWRAAGQLSVLLAGDYALQEPYYGSC